MYLICTVLPTDNHCNEVQNIWTLKRISWLCQRFGMVDGSSGRFLDPGLVRSLHLHERRRTGEQKKPITICVVTSNILGDWCFWMIRNKYRRRLLNAVPAYYKDICCIDISYRSSMLKCCVTRVWVIFIDFETNWFFCSMFFLCQMALVYFGLTFAIRTKIW